MARPVKEEEEESEDEEIEEEEQADGWNDWEAGDEDSEAEFLCLFCDTKWNSREELFNHCVSDHAFDFEGIRKSMGLGFYGSFKLINYIRFKVASNKCWRCGLGLQSKESLLNHLHEVESFNYDCSAPWGDDKYLQPFLQDDALLHSFGGDDDDDDFYDATFLPDERDPMVEVVNVDEALMKSVIDEEDILDIVATETGVQNEIIKGMDVRQSSQVPSKKSKDKSLKVSFANVMAREIKNVNESYFGSYSSFSIHKEMISDKVRMDAYRGAILGNPTLMNQATVMDVGCGTGILSLFAAQAGASRVFAIEASEKMASVAKRIAKDNGLLKQNGEPAGAIDVVHGMVEELDKRIEIPPHSVDVLLSEWMGYCLLYESMLSSVLYARDLWLKPGGAILPDMATIFVAGFGRGGTSFPFWEDVYGFDMSCIGKEVTEDAAQLPIVDIVDSQTLVTDPCVLHIFDLVTMRREDMDFTANFELTPKSQNSPSSSPNMAIWCYGVVLWFDTGFTSRFCKETPTILSTSPFGPKTHWSQILLTFKEPIALLSENSLQNSETARKSGLKIGTDVDPAVKIMGRISIARASRHRSIDASMEITGVGHDGGTQTFPVQIFNM
ncbi:probable protein arginine N-methyltransferase 3 [Amborella trichopoda]|uniref:C2H2-type domain-containing protein n=1 Tax=Amborella trichopoda TaxID=13333 RepID=W1NRF1_AMBTC|nr:probable protein arginine N-methyltransferase 3 [Amborella trichopoda]ERM98123.1 hypothetical protein AMTR_s00095p00048830 [Amborella trichopoda]|eukprot:XP_006832845.1 probable protein arginine N-methyltransferase 3 [Amborella trichopoda]